MRVVVVGASSGLGRVIGVALAQRGAQVALMARRLDLLAEAAAEAGPNAHAISCDVIDSESCASAVAKAVDTLGGIDGVVYCPGVGVLRRIEELTLEDWHKTFDTNVAGASIFTAAVLPHLKESGGSVAYLSSISASFTAPWPGLAAYIVTKAGMDKLVEAWRAEHPEVGFTRVAVGDCPGGEGGAASQFTAGFDMGLLGELFPTWLSKGLLTGTLLDAGELVHLIDSVLRLGASAAIPTVTIIPRQSPAATPLQDLPDAALLSNPE